MQFRLFSMPAVGNEEMEEELNCFLRSHRIISVQKSLVTDQGTPFWCFCVEYLEGSGNKAAQQLQKSKRVDYKEILSEEDFAIYAKLRDHRKELAEQSGRPVYAICTNEQLACMVQNEPKRIADLMQIEGFGEAKAKSFGESFLTVLQQVRNS